jgi:hypothetical protein
MLVPFIESRLATRRARLVAAVVDNVLLLPGGGLQECSDMVMRGRHSWIELAN